MSGCGLLTKGSDSKDDLVPCGMKLYLGKTAKDRVESVLLCTKCKSSSGLVEGA